MSAPLTEIRPLVIALVMLVLLAATALVYAPGLDGVFVFDSVERVIRNESLQIESADPEQLVGAAYAAQADYPQRGLAYITLALNYLLADRQFAPFAFKATNLAIHLFNGLLVFILAGQILSRWREQNSPTAGASPSPAVAALALAATGLWLLHPIQLTSVLYVVQRMTSLAATWVLGGAILFMYARARYQEGGRYALTLMFASVIACTAIGFLCKQNALLLPAYVAVLELFLFRRSTLSTAHKRGLQLYFSVTLGLPFLIGLVIVSMHPDLVTAGYQSRDFDMWQRLMTEARVLFFYVGLLLIPDARRFGLYHDDIAVSMGPMEPVSTIVALAAWVLVGVAIVYGARRRSPWAFAAAWFLVGHAMESSILPLELAHEHRNYVPAAGLWMAVAYYVGVLWQHAGRMRTLVLCATAVWILSLALIGYTRALAWQNPASLMASLARHHPQSYRSVVGYAFNSIPAEADLAVRFDAFKHAAMLDGRAITALLEMAKIATAVGHFIGSAKAEPSPANADLPSVSAMTLLADGGHNSRLLAALDEEINRRLATEPVRTDSVVALVGIVDCSLGGSRECIELRPQSRVWHEAALSNPRLPDGYRAALELSLAKIHAASGDYDSAVAHARKAGTLEPGNLQYRLQEATLYALLERWNELGAALDEIERRFSGRAESDATFKGLRNQYGTAKN